MPLPVPAWATNFVPGQYDTASIMNTIGNNGTFLTNVPIFVGTQTAAQALANATTTAVALDSTIVDSYAGHSNVTNNNRYTPTVAGWYLCFGMVSFASNSTGGRDIELRKNGTTVTVGQGAGQGAAGGINTTEVAWALIQCNGTTDYIDLMAYQSSGGSLNTVNVQTGLACLWYHA